MELFQKIDKILEYYKLSRTKLAEKLSIRQNTLNGYFTTATQEKLSPYLWKILEIFPDISRNWLFFGEGEMFDKNAASPEEVNVLKNRIEELEDELRQEQKLNRKLTNKILDADITDRKIEKSA